MPLQAHEIPSVVIIRDPSSWEADVASNVVYSTTDSGTTDLFIDYSLYTANFVDLDNTSFEWIIIELENSFTDIPVELQTDDIDAKILKTVTELFIALKAKFSYNIDTEWYLTSQQRDVLNDTLMNLRINIGTVPVDDDLDVDIYMSRVKYYRYPADIYCSVSGVPVLIDTDVELGLGRITRMRTDIYSSVEDTQYLNTYVCNASLGMAPFSIGHCCSYSSITCSGITCSGVCTYSGGSFCAPTYTELLDLCSTYSGCVYEDLDYCINTYYGSTYSGGIAYDPTYSGCTYDFLEYHTNIYASGLPSELHVAPGRISFLSSDVFSTKLGVSDGIVSEIKTRSLFTGDFFIDRDNYTTASSIAWVDIVDYLYPINTDETFLYVDDVLASGIYFEDIPNGKRLYYDPLNDFYTDGVLTYSIHSENIMGEVEDKDFYLLYGYDLRINEVLDWGPNENVLVRAEAQNLVFCPGLAGEAYDFTTVDLESINLRCFITPVGWEDLNFKITPQSTVFFYGKTYTVRLENVKDFAGNIMPDLEYTFTIEDPSA